MIIKLEGFNLWEFICRCNDDCEAKHLENNKQLENLIIGLTMLRHAFWKEYKTRNVKIIINSGVRCQAHNKAEGGVVNSDHLLGAAADIQVYVKGWKVDDRRVIEVAEKYLGQFIRYIALTTKPGAVHISFHKDVL